jgi:hypothetical protein
MSQSIRLVELMPANGSATKQQLPLLGLLCLGVIESLAERLLDVDGALQLFFHAENALFVRKQLRSKTADEVMSRGVQLADLFEALPKKEAQRELQSELAMMRSLCRKLLGKRKMVA